VRAPRPNAFEYHHVEVDTGVVQIDSLHLDERATIRAAREFMRSFDSRVDREAGFLKGQRAALIVADVPPLGIAAAVAVGLPAVVLGNFTWDWIYSAYPESGDVVAACGEAYARATLALRLPMHGGFGTISQIGDLPFVARRSRRDPADTRAAMAFPAARPLVLVSFGGFGLRRIDEAAVRRLNDYVVLMSGVNFDEQSIYAAGLRYEDIVRAVDVVVSKPGYGIIAECLANDTALLYTSRGHFVEYDVLTAAMPRFLRTAFIAHDDLFAGRWQAHLDNLLAAPGPREKPAVNGAQVAAARLLAMI
jgi:L-arabinokinase